MFSSRLALQARPATLARAAALRAAGPQRGLTTSRIAMALLSDVIKHDHQELEGYYNNILGASSDDEKVRWQNQFTWELARHAIGEELVMYPVMEKAVKDGKEIADHDREMHGEVKRHLSEFQSLQPSDPHYETALKDLWAPLAQHMKEESTVDLPKLEEALSKEESEKVAERFQSIKKFLPTRSHPMAPDQPTIAGLLAAPIDKLGDMFRKFPKD